MTLPFAALGEVPGAGAGASSSSGIVEEPPDSDDDVEVVRDKLSEYGMVQNFAAETIQGTYRYNCSLISLRCHHCGTLTPF